MQQKSAITDPKPDLVKVPLLHTHVMDCRAGVSCRARQMAPFPQFLWRTCLPIHRRTRVWRGEECVFEELKGGWGDDIVGDNGTIVSPRGWTPGQRSMTGSRGHIDLLGDNIRTDTAGRVGHGQLRRGGTHLSNKVVYRNGSSLKTKATHVEQLQL